MATSVISKIIRFERIYNKKKDGQSVHAMALSYYLGYAISGQRELLHKANFVLQSSDFHADLSLSFLHCFIAYESDNIDLLEQLLERLRPRRKAMENHQPTFYAYYLYFDSLLELASRKERAANKQFKALRDLCASGHVVGAELLLASASMNFGDMPETFNYLLRAYKKGERSPLFYLCLARAFGQATPRPSEGELLLPLILWALNTGYYIDGIILKHQHLAENVLRRRPGVAEKLYAFSPLDWVLHIVATSRMISNDISEQAFYYYKEAEVRQIYFPQLYDFLLRSAYRNDIEDISSFSLAQYLKSEPNVPLELMPFVYHLVVKGGLSGKHEEELMPLLAPQILRFACYCLDNHLLGKYYYSLYKYILDKHSGADVGASRVDKKYVHAANELVKSLLFTFEISGFDPKVKKVLVQQEFVKGTTIHEPKDGRVRVNLWSETPRVSGFDETMRLIIDSDLTVTRLIETANLELYRRFYAQGYRSPEMLIYLAQHYIDEEASEHLTLTAIEVFEHVKEMGVERRFLRMVGAALGNHYAKKGDFTRAVEYFKDLDESSINPKYLEQMLAAYINAKDYEAASRLIDRFRNDLPDKSLFNALKQMSEHISKLARTKGLAAVAATLMTRGWHDAALMEVVLAHHAAPLLAWVDLARVLSNLGIFEPKLYTKILDNAILTRTFTKAVQNVFVEMAEKAGDTQIVEDFAMYLCYEVLAADGMPEKAALAAMEQVYDAHAKTLLGYALSHVYIKSGIFSEKAREILTETLDAAKHNDIIFPIFKVIKDKSLMTAYIEKNTPLTYRGRPGRSVTMHWRIGETGDFAEVNMKYVAFGMYMCHIPHFYGEEIEYYFCENREKGSVKTAPAKIVNKTPHKLENDGDLYYTINSALLYEQMFKYEQVEEIVTTQLAKKAGIRAKIM
ncbi:MAG: DUF5717 family protein [Defluviitaleaceae bacterium]|nr:DUF5717 family protein [Defluviitaleaceae bacterium]